MTTTFMSSPKLLFTSESVTEGHPDKLCDQIADAVLDACLEQDPMSRVACEVATKTGFVMLLGEITTHAFVNFDELVRKVVNEIGYDSSEERLRRQHLRRAVGHRQPEPGHRHGRQQVPGGQGRRHRTRST